MRSATRWGRMVVGALLALLALMALAPPAPGAMNYVRDAGTVAWSNETGAAVDAGTVVDVGSRYGVVMANVASGSVGTVFLQGVFVFSRTANEPPIALDDPLYWVAGSTAVTKTATSGTFLGSAAQTLATTTGAAKVEVDLNSIARDVIAAAVTGLVNQTVSLAPLTNTVLTLQRQADPALTNTVLTLQRQADPALTNTVLTLQCQADPALTNTVLTLQCQADPALTNTVLTVTTGPVIDFYGATQTVVTAVSIANQAADAAAVTNVTIANQAAGAAAVTNATIANQAAGAAAVTNATIANQAATYVVTTNTAAQTVTLGH